MIIVSSSTIHPVTFSTERTSQEGGFALHSSGDDGGRSVGAWCWQADHEQVVVKHISPAPPWHRWCARSRQENRTERLYWNMLHSDAKLTDWRNYWAVNQQKPKLTLTNREKNSVLSNVRLNSICTRSKRFHPRRQCCILTINNFVTSHHVQYLISVSLFRLSFTHSCNDVRLCLVQSSYHGWLYSYRTYSQAYTYIYVLVLTTVLKFTHTYASIP